MDSATTSGLTEFVEWEGKVILKLSKFFIIKNIDMLSIDFLNQTVKVHALERINKLIPASLEYGKNEKTRLQAAIPVTIFLALLVTIIFYVDIFVLSLTIGFIAIVWVLPKIISRLMDPTITEKWLKVPAEKEMT